MPDARPSTFATRSPARADVGKAGWRTADRAIPVRAEMGRISRESSSEVKSDVFIQSRDLRPLSRYFPEVDAALLAGLPAGCVVDGEIVIATAKGLDFDALQLRLHPAASRIARLARETPAAFVAFDLLAVGWEDLRDRPQDERRDPARADARDHDPAHSPDTDDARSGPRPPSGWRGSRAPASTASWRSRSATVRTGQARDDQDQARAHGRLRGRGIPLAQSGNERARRIVCCSAVLR